MTIPTGSGCGDGRIGGGNVVWEYWDFTCVQTSGFGLCEDIGIVVWKLWDLICVETFVCWKLRDLISVETSGSDLCGNLIM